MNFDIDCKTGNFLWVVEGGGRGVGGETKPLYQTVKCGKTKQEFSGMLCRTCFVPSHSELNESMIHILAKSIGLFMR